MLPPQRPALPAVTTSLDLHRTGRRSMPDGVLLTRVAAHAQGLSPVRRGVFVADDDWMSAFPEERTRAAAAAYQIAARGAPVVYSHESAAALWGLPLFRHRTDRVHVTLTQHGAASTPGVFRHRDRLRDDEIVWIDGRSVGVTSLARTVFDLARMRSPETATAAADAALRRVGSIPGTRLIDDEPVHRLRDELLGLAGRSPGARGIVQAREVAAFADPRAEYPGESVSRLYLSWLGFASPDLQFPVPSPHGGSYEVDFAFPGWLGEFDGDGKYLDAGMRAGRTLEQVLLDEKRREDWIRGVTGLPIIRWQMRHLVSVDAFRRHLAAFGITPSRTR
ncbi:hypothetical protein AB0N73_07680 [Microbacterium sp. NPDC089189]|uniref:hypothetical protein n=1 Tax=Microbacterium sp. NPDC089189 TaxID=3154972 RepID=UPI003417CDEC